MRLCWPSLRTRNRSSPGSPPWTSASSNGLSNLWLAQGRDDAFTSRHPALKTSKGPCNYGPKSQLPFAMTSSATLSALPSIDDDPPDRYSRDPCTTARGRRRSHRTER
jgi:hypothetical protein